MSDIHVTPRIDGTLLNSYENQVVRIIGRVESNSDANSVSFYTPSTVQDNVLINVTISQDIYLEQGKWYELIARIQKGPIVRAVDAQPFGENLNEKAIAGLVTYSHKASEIFY